MCPGSSAAGGRHPDSHDVSVRGRIAAHTPVCYLLHVAKKQMRRPTTVPPESAVRNPGANKGRNAKPGFIDLPDADDIWDQINFWTGKQDHLLQPETIAARDVAKTVTRGGAQAIDAYYTGGMAGSLYNNVLRPRVDMNISTNANWGRFSRDVAIAGGTAAATAAVVKGAQIAAESPVLQHYGNRVLNAIKGERVIVHSSPVSGLTQIDPRAGSAILPNQKVVFGWDSRAMSPKDWFLRRNEFSVDPALEAGVHGFSKEGTARYTGWKPSYETDEIISTMKPGSTYVATVPKDSTRISPNVSPWQGNRRYDYEPGVQPGAVVSSSPAHVKAEIPLTRDQFGLTSITHLGPQSPVKPTGEQYRAMVDRYTKFRAELADKIYRAGGNYNYTNPYGAKVISKNPMAPPAREEFVPLPFGHNRYIAVSEKAEQAKNTAKQVAAKIKSAAKPKPKMKSVPVFRPPSVFD